MAKKGKKKKTEAVIPPLSGDGNQTNGALSKATPAPLEKPVSGNENILPVHSGVRKSSQNPKNKKKSGNENLPPSNEERTIHDSSSREKPEAAAKPRHARSAKTAGKRTRKSEIPASEKKPSEEKKNGKKTEDSFQTKEDAFEKTEEPVSLNEESPAEKKAAEAEEKPEVFEKTAEASETSSGDLSEKTQEMRPEEIPSESSETAEPQEPAIAETEKKSEAEEPDSEKDSQKEKAEPSDSFKDSSMSEKPSQEEAAVSSEEANGTAGDFHAAAGFEKKDAEETRKKEAPAEEIKAAEKKEEENSSFKAETAVKNEPNEKPHARRISAREANERNAAKEAGLKEETLPKKQLEKKARKKRALPGKILIGLAVFVLLAATACGFGGFMFYQSLLENMPPLDVSKREEYSMASKIYDRDGNFVAEYGTNENVEWANSDEIPQMLKDAFIAIEDERFYSHNGIDLKRLVGAVIGQLTGSSSYGASTITQQLIKNTHLSQEVTYTRKAQEIHLAMELEKVMSKDDILVWYMNTLYLGDSNYGVKVAAKDYFGKELYELSLRECAILAGLAQSPNEYNPRLNLLKGDLSPTNRRISNVLYKMLETGKISEDQYEAAMKGHLVILRNSRRYELYDYPTYVEYAVENVAKKLLEAENTPINDETLTEKKQWLRSAGYTINTAFDRNIQDIAQDAITNFDRYPATVTGTEVEVSAVIMDQHTGEVVAMVGGRHEPDKPEGFNRATDSTQAVGSSIKPLSVYAPACETGDYPGTTVLDVQEGIEGYGEDNSYPNGDHTGAAITMRKALELSHNIPAARFLLEHVGIDRSYDFMVKEGFAPENLAKTPAGLALGATDVTTLEMTGAYACLANGGEYIEPHAYRKVTDRFGNVILNAAEEIDRHRAFSKSTAWLVTDMMHSNMIEGYGVNARLDNVTSAGKTGTHEHQVISFGGYTPYYTSFLRISADDYVRMINSSSYYQSAPLWKAYMNPIHEGLEDREIQDFTKEDVGIEEYYVCSNSGMLAQSWCAGHKEYAAPNNKPTEYCDGHIYGSGEGDWSEWQQESSIDYNDPEWYLKGWWDEEGNFHPY